jgi:hypothetical protein
MIRPHDGQQASDHILWLRAVKNEVRTTYRVLLDSL